MKKRSMISFVGRPNVGKSSLFNALLKRKMALVMDYEGVTRDRRFSEVAVDVLGGRFVKMCDTGGWVPESWRRGREDRELLKNIESQILKALAESSVVVQVVDVREGITPLDEEIFQYLRRLGLPLVIAANKADVNGESYQIGDFYKLGAEEVIPVSAEHKWGMVEFWERIARFLPDATEEETVPLDSIRVCIVGRPNVGKSSLLNHLVGEVRSVASDKPGTTTDPVDVELHRAGHNFLLVDTAGIRRHAKRKDEVEDLAALYAKRNLNKADVAFLMVDASDGITTQDSRIAALVEESGCAVILLANKWDKAPHNIKSDSKEGLKKFRELVEKDWPFLDFAPLVAISAESGRVYGAAEGTDSLEPEGPWHLPKKMEDLWLLALDLIEARQKKVSKQELEEVVQEAFAVGPNWIEKLGSFRQIHQVGHRPPQFLAMVRDANEIPEALRRYLKRAMRERFGYRGNPIRWVFKHKR